MKNNNSFNTYVTTHPIKVKWIVILGYADDDILNVLLYSYAVLSKRHKFSVQAILLSLMKVLKKSSVSRPINVGYKQG